MKATVVTDEAAGTAGMALVERPEPQAAINDVGGRDSNPDSVVDTRQARADTSAGRSDNGAAAGGPARWFDRSFAAPDAALCCTMRRIWNAWWGSFRGIRVSLPKWANPRHSHQGGTAGRARRSAN